MTTNHKCTLHRHPALLIKPAIGLHVLFLGSGRAIGLSRAHDVGGADLFDFICQAPSFEIVRSYLSANVLAASQLHSQDPIATLTWPIPSCSITCNHASPRRHGKQSIGLRMYFLVQ